MPTVADRVYSFRRTLVQTRARGHSASACVAYRFALAVTSRFPGEDGQRREFDFTRRRGIGPKGCTLPEEASDAWLDPVEWALRIEAVDYRTNSRQCRDDVIGIPREMVAAGEAETAIAAYAQRIAKRWRTPVHWVIHDLNSPNPHAHVLYAGRSLDGPDAFARTRDRIQDQVSDPGRDRLSITELHTEYWTEVAADFGYELDFTPDGERAQKHIGPHAWAMEKMAIQEEIADRISSALDPADPLDAGDLLALAQEATAGLTVTEALALDRDPVTESMRECAKPMEAPPEVELDPPRRHLAAVEELSPPRRAVSAEAELPPPRRAVSAEVELSPPRRAVSAEAELPPPRRAVSAEVELPPPRRAASAEVELPPPRRAVSAEVELSPPRRAASAEVELPPPRRAVSAELSPPRRAVSKDTSLGDLPSVEVDRRRAREQEERDRLKAALENGAEAAGEQLIWRHAGHASAHPYIRDLGTVANARAIDDLRPHTIAYQVRERHRRKANRMMNHEAVTRAIERWGTWWRKRQARLLPTLFEKVWPAHWEESEAQHQRIIRELAEQRERERTVQFRDPLLRQPQRKQPDRPPTRTKGRVGRDNSTDRGIG